MIFSFHEARLCVAGHGQARHGQARPGTARQGAAWLGEARQGNNYTSTNNN